MALSFLLCTYAPNTGTPKLKRQFITSRCFKQPVHLSTSERCWHVCRKIRLEECQYKVQRLRQQRCSIHCTRPHPHPMKSVCKIKKISSASEHFQMKRLSLHPRSTPHPVCLNQSSSKQQDQNKKTNKKIAVWRIHSNTWRQRSHPFLDCTSCSMLGAQSINWRRSFPLEVTMVELACQQIPRRGSSTSASIRSKLYSSVSGNR